MAPRSFGYRQMQQRMRRTLGYGTRRMRPLSLQLSELTVDYFDKYAPYDYMDMDFATSLARESCVDACTFLVAIVYMDRLRHTNKQFFETTDPREIYLSSLVIATKYLYDGGLDEFIYNDEWAASSGQSLKRINEMELELLNCLSWNINVNNAEFSNVLKEIEIWVARNTISRYGCCTYNELAVLSDDTKFLLDALKSLLSLVAVFTIVYSAVAISILVVPQMSICSTLPTTNVSTQRITLETKWPILGDGLNCSELLDDFSQVSSELLDSWKLLSTAIDLKNIWSNPYISLPMRRSDENWNLAAKESIFSTEHPTYWSIQHTDLPILSHHFNRSAAFFDTTITCSFA